MNVRESLLWIDLLSKSTRAATTDAVES